MTVQAGLFVARDAGGNGTTPKGARTALAGLLAKNADGTVRTGVLMDGLGPVVTGAAGMSYSIRKHVAVTKATEANGPVLVPNDGVVSVSTTAAPGSNSRIDIIYVWQRLVTGDGGSETTNAPVIGVVQGSASASPVAPAPPTGALELARVTVPAGTVATSGLTFTQGAFTAATSTVQSGVTSAVHTAGGVQPVPIVFPVPFPGIPQVFATMQASNPTVFTEAPSISAITATGCTIYVSRNAAGTTPVMWFANYSLV